MVSPIMLRQTAINAQQKATRKLTSELRQSARQVTDATPHQPVATNSFAPSLTKVVAGAGAVAGLYLTAKLLLSRLQKAATQKTQAVVKQATEKISSEASKSTKANASVATSFQIPSLQGLENLQTTLNGLLTSKRGKFILKAAQTELGNAVLQGLISAAAPKLLPGVNPILLKQLATPDNIRLVLNSGLVPSLQKNLNALATQSPQAVASFRQFIAQHGEPLAEQVAKQTGIEKETLMNKLKIFA